MDGTKNYSDEELIYKIKEENSSESVEELINRHSALCIDVSKKYHSSLIASGVPVDDLYKEKNYIIYKSAMSFNPSKKVKFTTWLGNQMRFHCLNTLNKNNNANTINLEHQQIDSYNNNASAFLETKKIQHEVEYIFDILSKLKDPRIKEVFNLRYFSSKKKECWASIGKKIGVSTQTAINLHKRGVKILEKKINSYNKADII